MQDTTVYLFEKFIEIEERHDLFALEINNIKIWQYVRFTFCTHILEEITGIRTTNRGSRRTNGKSEKNYRGEWIKKQQFLLRRKKLLVVNHPRRVKAGEVYKCFVTDTLLRQITDSYYVFEDEYQGGHLNPVPTKSLKYRDIDCLKRLFKYDGGKYDDEVRNMVENISGIFEKELSGKFSDRVKKELHGFTGYALERVFYGRLHAEIILRLIRPKAVIVTVSYEINNQTLIEVAKRMGIPTIELQHGRIGDSHAAYNFKSIRNLETFPDYLFVYGKYEKEIPRYPIAKTQIYAAGYPELERRAELYRKNRRKSKYKIVTFISSPADGNIISKYAVDFAQKIKGNNVKVVYKLHPSEYIDWKQYYPDFEKAGINVVSSNRHDIYYYLGHSDYVVGISSTVLFEAMLFDTDIVIIKEQDYRKCKAIYQHHCASLVSNADELAEVVMSKEEHQEKKDADFYFERNAIQKMKCILDGILKSGKNNKS